MLCFPKTCDVLAVFIQMWAERCSAKQNEYPSTDGTTPPQYLWRLHNLLAACLISCIWSVSNSSCWGGGLKFAANKMHLEVRRISATKKTGHPRREQAELNVGPLGIWMPSARFGSPYRERVPAWSRSETSLCCPLDLLRHPTGAAAAGRLMEERGRTRLRVGIISRITN